MAGAIAVCYEAPTRFARYTVADGAGIAKGTLLKLSTPNTASAASADNDVVGGIAWMEKVASDGSTEIVAALDGIWGITTSAAAVTIGEQVVINGANTIKKYTTLDAEKGYVLGRSLETIGASATVIRVRVQV